MVLAVCPPHAQGHSLLKRIMLCFETEAYSKNAFSKWQNKVRIHFTVVLEHSHLVPQFLHIMRLCRSKYLVPEHATGRRMLKLAMFSLYYWFNLGGHQRYWKEQNGNYQDKSDLPGNTEFSNPQKTLQFTSCKSGEERG